MWHTIRALSVSVVGLLVLGFGFVSHAQTTDKTRDLSKWDRNFELFDANGTLLSKITIKNGKLDFLRASGQSRAEFLKTLPSRGLVQALAEKDGGFDVTVAVPSQIVNASGNVLATLTTEHGAGLRKIYSSILSPLAINSQGHLGLALTRGGLFQALKEKDDGFDLANGEGSQILNQSGSVLAVVITEKGAPALTFASGQSLKTLYDAGLQFFYYKFEPIRGEMKPHGIKLIKDD